MTVSVMLKNNSFNFFDERQTNPRDSLIWKSQMRKSLLGAIYSSSWENVPCLKYTMKRNKITICIKIFQCNKDLIKKDPTLNLSRIMEVNSFDFKSNLIFHFHII